MKKQSVANIWLLTAAIIWGFAFVAQRKGMEFSGPLTFNGLRFLLGCLTVLPTLLLFKTKKSLRSILLDKKLIISGILAGIALFFAITFQQAGIIYTTAGNAGFITSLYIIIVPVCGLFRPRSSSAFTWTGAIIAFAGLYLLSFMNQDVGFNLQPGDLLVLISAFFWASHIVILSYVAPRHDFRLLAIVQYAFAGGLSLILGLIFEPYTAISISSPLSLLPVLYAGILSVGLGFTLQVAGQRHAKAEHAGIILSLEAVFAAIGGYLILGETMTQTQLTGCALMLVGVVVSQIRK